MDINFVNFVTSPGASGQCEEIDICQEDNPCQNNSTCSRVSPGETSCQCLPGFTGSLCQHNIDDCASDPCGHGQCTDLVNGYSCDCEPGYDGTCVCLCLCVCVCVCLVRNMWLWSVRALAVVCEDAVW